ncbi:nitric oxide synthase 2b, inducible [Leucoraja erinacea]|uniref:nitric oxide synthase 2b, inducible n=1 Tax=Leucoraja erinaceus TaxID=7782 RepID=UPI0024578D6A|nr:nitric oxide synthase 2b, inducible [Leucoraja erinacea]
MLCPWSFLMKPKYRGKYEPGETKTADVNNNEEKSIGNGIILPSKAKYTQEPQHVKEAPSVARCPFAPKFVKLSNVEDGAILQDTLHHKAVKNMPCQSSACRGSLMTPNAMTKGPRDKAIPPQEILPQALDFINQYYQSFKSPKTEEHLARLEQVTKSITDTGTYDLTLEELTFSAKQAWRNAPRCIGRIQWSNLQLFDARNCTTAKEMFEHICTHLKYASNDGNLRSTITVFPQRSDGKHDFRVWNSQLVKYAGYQLPDGSIIGDPAGVAFTQLCINMGWTPRYGRFDVLPLVLQANGQDPELFEIPPEVTLEVEIEHPTYEWFKEMGLRWYALPAVANMLLEVGGLEFPGCPFNGWYMSSEIGVRDFCDVQRYNVLEEVGKKMGLETNKLSSLWKDKALVEINIAVIHSFQKQNVTIMDHHTASQSFMKHLENEFRLRGGCPGDWVWLVPPISGSITKVFHQELLNYILSPFYYYQIDAWKTHNWQDERLRPKKNEIKFKQLAMAALFTSVLMRKTMAKRTKATILYATETGKSETFAKRLCTLFNGAFNAKVVCMDDYDMNNLAKESLVLVVASTFGNGDSPGNGEVFKKSLFNKKLLMAFKFRYGIFGLGSRQYPQFCAFAHTLDKKLEQLGAIRMSATGEGDELGGQEESFVDWAIATLKTACKAFHVRGNVELGQFKTASKSSVWDPSRYRFVMESKALDLCSVLSKMQGKKILPMKLKSKKNLQSLKSSRSTILVELSCQEPNNLHYQPGEHVGVFPRNQEALVTNLMKRLKEKPTPHQCVQVEVNNGTTAKDWKADERLPPCTLEEAFTYFLDITTPPSQHLLKKFAQLATEESEKNRLLELSQNSQEYETWRSFHSPTTLEVLEEFESVHCPAMFLFTQLMVLKPRYYSISSSLDMNPGEVHLTVAVVNYKTRDGQGPMHHGVCSTWLDTLEKDEIVPCYVRSTAGFQLPKNQTKPCILVGPGTGIAPFRSFWQQRQHDREKQGIKCGPMTLVFGCRDSQLDHIYKEETLKLKNQGVLKGVYTAYSREPGMKKTYVQDILRGSLASEVYSVLHKEKGHIYICGEIKMAQDVTDTLKAIVAKQGNMSIEDAEEFLTELKNQKRYHEDIFGATFQK